METLDWVEYHTDAAGGSGRVGAVMGGVIIEPGGPGGGEERDCEGLKGGGENVMRHYISV